ncbi:hypothetical protein PENSPDRAFT_758767 [Peniophora sp. CONT]|nr:hypothetical protein PENSPDRAFT_758767 [Peniophora sp. CONT]
MGKWTSQHTDDVLGSKFKSLVSGSVRRAKLEDRAGYTISYDDFVKELDAGDSFTTSLVDVLVQEIALRRTRKSSEDKRLISDATSRGLRMLGNQARTYHPRRVGPPPSATAMRRVDYLSSFPPSSFPPDDMGVDEDGDSTDSGLDPAGAAEGARLNTDLWDAMATGPSSSSGTSTTILRGSIRRARGSDLPYPPPAPPASSSLTHGLRALVESDLPSLTSSHRHTRTFANRGPRAPSRSTEFSDVTASRRRAGARTEVEEHENEEVPTMRRLFPFSGRRYGEWPGDAHDEYTAWGTSSMPSTGSQDDASPGDEVPPETAGGPPTPIPRLRRAGSGAIDGIVPWHTAFEVGRRHTGRSSSATVPEPVAEGWARADESW